MDFPNFITWFKNSNNTFNTFNYATKEFKTVLILEYKINQFELFKGYEPDNDGLLKFSEDLIKWRDEILDESNFDYFCNKLRKNEKIYYRTCKGACFTRNLAMYAKVYIHFN